MVALYFVGLFASYLLVLRREGKRFPWGTMILVLVGLIAIAGGIVAMLIFYYHYHFIQKWPFLVK
jgi:sec-independent protein translocase protein TatC